MAQIKLFVTVEGAGSQEEAERLAMRMLMATKPVKTVLIAAGHEVMAKAAGPCVRCGALTDVRSELCPVCASDRAVERVLDDPIEQVPVLLQVAEAAVL